MKKTNDKFEESYKNIIEDLKKVKITLQLERDGKYIKKEIEPKIISALFDLQFMMDNACEKIFQEQAIKTISNEVSRLKCIDKCDVKLRQKILDNLKLLKESILYNVWDILTRYQEVHILNSKS